MKEIQIACKAADIVPIERLKIIQGDLKSLSKQNFEKLKNEIIDKGFSFAIHVWDDGKDLCVLDGTQRLRVVEHLVTKEGWVCQGLPVNYVKASSEKEAVLKCLGAAGMYGDPSDEGLYALMNKHQITMSDVVNISLPTIDLPTFEQSYFTEPSDGSEDVVPETPQTTDIKTGDLFQLGDHRLLCGDCTVRENIDRLMNGEKADMVFTDPPYNVNFKYNEYDDTKVSKEEWRAVAREWHDQWKSLAENIIVTPGCYNLEIWCQVAPEISHICCWVKMNGNTPGRVTYFWQWEPILFIGKFPRKRSSDVFIHYVNSAFLNDNACGCHPCPKPMTLWEDIVENFSEIREMIFDPFLGSGTTLIACEKTGRRCYGMEIDPIYCQVIVDRWEQFTSKKALKIPS